MSVRGNHAVPGVAKGHTNDFSARSCCPHPWRTRCPRPPKPLGRRYAIRARDAAAARCHACASSSARLARTFAAAPHNPHRHDGRCETNSSSRSRTLLMVTGWPSARLTEYARLLGELFDAHAVLDGLSAGRGCRSSARYTFIYLEASLPRLSVLVSPCIRRRSCPRSRRISGVSYTNSLSNCGSLPTPCPTGLASAMSFSCRSG